MPQEVPDSSGQSWPPESGVLEEMSSFNYFGPCLNFNYHYHYHYYYSLKENNALKLSNSKINRRKLINYTTIKTSTINKIDILLCNSLKYQITDKIIINGKIVGSEEFKIKILNIIKCIKNKQIKTTKIIRLELISKIIKITREVIKISRKMHKTDKMRTNYTINLYVNVSQKINYCNTIISMKFNTLPQDSIDNITLIYVKVNYIMYKLSNSTNPVTKNSRQNIRRQTTNFSTLLCRYGKVKYGTRLAKQNLDALVGLINLSRYFLLYRRIRQRRGPHMSMRKLILQYYYRSYVENTRDLVLIPTSFYGESITEKGISKGSSITKNSSLSSDIGHLPLILRSSSSSINLRPWITLLFLTTHFNHKKRHIKVINTSHFKPVWGDSLHPTTILNVMKTQGNIVIYKQYRKIFCTLISVMKLRGNLGIYKHYRKIFCILISANGEKYGKSACKLTQPQSSSKQFTDCKGIQNQIKRSHTKSPYVTKTAPP